MATRFAPRAPPKPPRLSISTVWPRDAETLAATGRANTSVASPEGNGTSQVTGRVGQSAERAGTLDPAANRPAKAPRLPISLTLTDASACSAALVYNEQRRPASLPIFPAGP